MRLFDQKEVKTMNENEEIKEILKKILKWTKFQGLQRVKQILENTLNSDTKKLIYEFSDGRSSPAIAGIAGVSAQTVRDNWKDWAILGVVEIHPDYKKRYHRIFSLKEVGIEVPQISEPVVTKRETNEGRPE